jgi:hypothetical protein
MNAVKSVQVQENVERASSISSLNATSNSMCHHRTTSVNAECKLIVEHFAHHIPFHPICLVYPRT